jgi:hypothetical protein
LTFLITDKIIFEDSDGNKTYYPDVWDHGEYFDSQPCSARSLYKVAHSTYSNADLNLSFRDVYKFRSGYGIERLQPICIKEIMKGLTVDNVMEELYTEHSTTYPALFELQKEYLLKNFVSLVLQIIKCGMLTGMVLHRRK